MNSISPEDARWLALLIDTEGNILVRRSKGRKSDLFCASTCAANTCKALVDTARDMVGLGSVLSRWNKKSRVPVYYWILTSQQAAAFLRVIYPYLIVKPRQARVAIYAQSLNQNRGGAKGQYGKGSRPLTEEEINLKTRLWTINKQLNNHGNPDVSWIPKPDEITKPQDARLSGGYEAFAAYQITLPSYTLGGGEIFRKFQVSHRQAYRWAKRWTVEHANLTR